MSAPGGVAMPCVLRKRLGVRAWGKVREGLATDAKFKGAPKTQ